MILKINVLKCHLYIIKLNYLLNKYVIFINGILKLHHFVKINAEIFYSFVLQYFLKLRYEGFLHHSLTSCQEIPFYNPISELKVSQSFNRVFSPNLLQKIKSKTHSLARETWWLHFRFNKYPPPFLQYYICIFHHYERRSGELLNRQKQKRNSVK